MAENAYQKHFIEKNDIRYGGVLVNHLFDNNPKAEQNLSLFITFEADRIQKAKEPFYLVTEQKAAIPDKYNEVIGRGRLSGSASTTFFSDQEKENYDILHRILFECPDLWGEDVGKFDPAKIQDDDTFFFFTITKKEYDELDGLTFPLYFLDFETMQMAIPEYQGTRPYAQIPFQYSLHYLETPEGELHHREFLGVSGEDPRRQIAQRLCQDIPANVWSWPTIRVLSVPG